MSCPYIGGYGYLQSGLAPERESQQQHNIALSAFLNQMPTMPPSREAGARKYAAEVRARNPQMQVKRIT